MVLAKKRVVAAALGLAVIGAALIPGPLKPVAAGGRSFLEGIDVSNWQGSVNWTSVRNAGKVFAFAKATEGLTYQDPWFPNNWSGMANNGIIRGAYHFGHPNTSAVSQAAFFVNYVQPVSGDLQLALDLEVTDGQSAAAIWNWVRYFIKAIKDFTGRPGVIYTGYYFWRDNVGNPGNNLDCPLWIASWGSNSPLVPNAWSTWTFWQYSSTGHVSGVNGNCDLDHFNGSIDRLLALTLP
jgi:GH25 family lysozyme M1 (1,4-beta-N-acetylmuramidase)